MHNRNNSIDLLKLILIFSVIIAHVLPYKYDSEYQTYIAIIIHGCIRCVVPLFFIITGYFIKNKINDSEKIKLILLRFLKMFVIWQILYSYLAYLLYKNNLFSNQKMIYSLLYGFGHLWYLNAVGLGILLLYLSKKLKTKNKLILAITLILLGYIFQILFEIKYLSNSMIMLHDSIGTTRNFLFFGFPYLLIGTIIENIKLKHTKFGMLFFLFCMIIEAIIYKLQNINIQNLFIFAIPTSIFIFKFILSYKKQTNLKQNPKMLLGIYLIHFYPVFYLTTIFPNNTIQITILKIFLVSIISSILFIIINFIDKKLKIFF